MKRANEKFCPHCGSLLFVETDKVLKKEYPYFCAECDENFYEIETLDIDEL